jgi:molecular chaperone GrpE
MTEYRIDDTDTFRDRWLRCAADLDNLKKRTAREIEKETRRAHQAVLLEFLHVVDSLERALGTDADEENAWYQGMKAIHEQMLLTLLRQGAKPFESEGDRFDPHRHEAVSSLAHDGCEEGTIVEVIKTGYEMEDGRLLRAAEVVTTHRSENDG